MKSPRWRWVALGAIALVGLTEFVIRQAGTVSFPIYTRNEQSGYSPRSDQQGTFLGSNRWVFNDRGMGVDKAWKPSNLTDVLLIGNSIVMGGNPYDQNDKLTPQLQSRLGSGCAIWPVAAGGWSTVNEVHFLQSNPDLVAASDFFIWVQMAGQLQRLSPWTAETIHPTKAPSWATWYVVSKALAARFPSTALTVSVAPEDALKHRQALDAMLERLQISSTRRPAGLIVLYPDLEQLALARAGLEWFADKQAIQRMADEHGLVLVDMTRFPQWIKSLYRDPVHPTVEGNAVLAEILVQSIVRAFAGHPCDMANAGATGPDVLLKP